MLKKTIIITLDKGHILCVCQIILNSWEDKSLYSLYFPRHGNIEKGL